MNKPVLLTDDQLQRIQATLARIKGGLNAPLGTQFEEPSHYFVPEHFNDVKN